MNNNLNIRGLNLKDFIKVEDIIFLDEPILTHLKREEKNFLLYLVDTIEQSDIFILLEVNESTIVEYLTGRISLKNVITSNRNLCHILEQDFEGIIIDSKVTLAVSIDENYLPSEDSFLNYEPLENSYYFKLIEDYTSKAYLNTLRENAFYLKFSPKTSKYQDTIGLTDLSNNLLENLSISFRNFLRADFHESFKYRIGDEAKQNRIIKQLLPDLDFRMVDLKYGSFEIGLSIDKTMKGSIEDVQIRNWAKEVGEKYKNIALSDYSQHNAEKIIKTYSEEDRKKIFEPIFKITENQNFNFQIKNSKNSKYTRISVIDKSVIEKIIPKPKIELNPEEKEYEILNLVTVVDKKQSKKSINLEDSLFSSSADNNVILKNKDFEKHGFHLEFEIEIQSKISTAKNEIIVSALYDETEFKVNVTSGKIDDGIKKITRKIYEYILEKDNNV